MPAFVAQLAERLFCKQRVVGSKPTGSSRVAAWLYDTRIAHQGVVNGRWCSGSTRHVVGKGAVRFSPSRLKRGVTSRLPDA